MPHLNRPNFMILHLLLIANISCNWNYWAGIPVFKNVDAIGYYYFILVGNSAFEWNEAVHFLDIMTNLDQTEIETQLADSACNEEVQIFINALIEEGFDELIEALHHADGGVNK